MIPHDRLHRSIFYFKLIRTLLNEARKIKLHHSSDLSGRKIETFAFIFGVGHPGLVFLFLCLD